MDTTDASQFTAALISQEPLRFVYEDEDGVVSLRDVLVQSVERTQTGNTIARCADNNRAESRTFRLDRVLRAFPPGSDVQVWAL